MLETILIAAAFTVAGWLLSLFNEEARGFLNNLTQSRRSSKRKRQMDRVRTERNLLFVLSTLPNAASGYMFNKLFDVLRFGMLAFGIALIAMRTNPMDSNILEFFRHASNMLAGFCFGTATGVATKAARVAWSLVDPTTNLARLDAILANEEL